MLDAVHPLSNGGHRVGFFPFRKPTEKLSDFKQQDRAFSSVPSFIVPRLILYRLHAGHKYSIEAMIFVASTGVDSGVVVSGSDAGTEGELSRRLISVITTVIELFCIVTRPTIQTEDTEFLALYARQV
jgi:hypothetical protein